MSPEEAYVLIGKMHKACTQIRLAIAVLEEDVPAGETTIERLTEAMVIIAEVREALAK